MYAGNVVKLLQHLVGKGNTTIQWNMEDEITKGIVVCREGQILHPRVKQALGL
jgi:NAD/NADP transhydrogenase alpha subunit